MPVLLYMDHHAPRAVTQGVRQRGVDVLTAYDDGSNELADPDLLERATVLGRTLFTQDEHFLSEAARRQAAGIEFSGVIYVHQLRLTVGQRVHDLELVAKIYEPEDLRNKVLFLPL